MNIEKNIDELPEELRKELSAAYIKGSVTDPDMDNKLVKMVSANGPISIDDILVAWYYAENKQVLKRTTLSNRLNALVKAEKITKIGKRGRFGPVKSTGVSLSDINQVNKVIR